MKKPGLGILIRLGLSTILLLALFLIIDWQDLLATLGQVQLSTYVVAYALYLCVMGLWSFRWYLFIRAADHSTRIPYLRVFRTILIGVFYSNFLPTSIGTDMGRLYELTPNHKPTVAIASTVLLDRLIGLISLALMAVGALAIGYQYANNQNIALTVGLLLGALVIFWLLFFNEGFMRRFKWLLKLPIIQRGENSLVRLYRALAFLQKQPALIGMAVAVSLTVQTVEVLAVATAARALGIEIELYYFFVFMPIIWVILTVPISISGLGVRESAFVFFFTQIGVTAVDAVALSLLIYGFSVMTGMIGGTILFTGNLKSYIPWLKTVKPVEPAHE